MMRDEIEREKNEARASEGAMTVKGGGVEGGLGRPRRCRGRQSWAWRRSRRRARARGRGRREGRRGGKKTKSSFSRDLGDKKRR